MEGTKSKLKNASACLTNKVTSTGRRSEKKKKGRSKQEKNILSDKPLISSALMRMRTTKTGKDVNSSVQQGVASVDATQNSSNFGTGYSMQNDRYGISNEIYKIREGEKEVVVIRDDL